MRWAGLSASAELLVRLSSKQLNVQLKFNWPIFRRPIESRLGRPGNRKVSKRTFADTFGDC